MKLFKQLLYDNQVYNINELIKNNELSDKKIKQISRIFELSIENHLLEIPLICDHKNGLWRRQKFGISTCSNHVESLHKTMNVQVYNISNIHRRFDIVLTKLFDIYSEFPQKSRIQAKKLLEKMRTKAIQRNIHQVHECNSHPRVGKDLFK